MADINTISLPLHKKNMRKIIYSKGDFVNGISVIKEVNPIIEKSGRKRTTILFKCPKCDNSFVSRVSDIVSGRTISCGCHKISLGYNRFLKHGMYNEKVYKTWQGAKTRCFNKNTDFYKNYGGRGITMHQEWVNDFTLFMKYVTSLDSYDASIIGNGKNQLSIDRINNDRDYEPGNLKWSTKKEQANNNRRWLKT